MFDPWSTLTVLTQPSIKRPLPTSFLDETGLVSRDCLVGLDDLFIEHLWSVELRPPELPTIPASVGKSLNTSAMQKAIRRGDVRRACAHARAGIALDAEHTFRRLAVCAVEDVGIGNLLAVGIALAVCGSKTVRSSCSAAAVATKIAHLLAASAKSRLACDLLSIVDFEPGLAGAKREMAERSVQDLVEVSRSLSEPLAGRLLAQWLIAGPARYPGATMPNDLRRPRSLIMSEMASSRVPLALYYVADRTASRLADAMFVPWLEIARLLRRDDDFDLACLQLDPTAHVAGVQTEAFDMHNVEGRRALALFAERCEAIWPFLRTIPSHYHRRAVHFAVFIVEGSLADRRVISAGIDLIRKNAQSAELSFCGLPPELHSSFLASVAVNLDCLNATRAEVARSSRADVCN